LAQDQTAGKDIDVPEIALVHDWLTGMRGGEKVLEALCQHYVNAPIWTMLCVKNSASETITSHPIYPSLLQHMPSAATRYRNYLPLYPLFAELHQAKASRLIISSSHAVAKSMARRRGRGPLHVCYIHTPMRYAWDLFEEYFGVKRNGWLLSRCFYLPVMKMLRAYDRATLKRVDLFIANSTHIAERVQRMYGREAKVVPPPVDLKRFITLERNPEDWYLVVSSLVPYKRVADAIQACHRVGVPLKVIGCGPEFKALSVLAERLGANVEMLGTLDNAALDDHYRRAKALLFPGIEDFGIVPVEAIASGCPVIAYAKGGVLDSMNEKTAVLYTEQTAAGLARAMEEFQRKSECFDVKEMRCLAARFSQEAFIGSFTAVVDELLATQERTAGNANVVRTSGTLDLSGGLADQH
jgi:glycosyltransferase involved in cell wall biosynthesis